jgi:hypothetical protein
MAGGTLRPDGPWWHQSRQLPAGPHIPGLLSTETTDGPGPTEMELRFEAAFEDNDTDEAFKQPAESAGPSGPLSEPFNADAGLTTLCAAANANAGSAIPGRHDKLDTNGTGMEGHSTVPETSTDKTDNGKGVEKNSQPDAQYDPRERLPPFLINTELGDTLRPAITRGYQNDPMAQNGVR